MVIIVYFTFQSEIVMRSTIAKRGSINLPLAIRKEFRFEQGTSPAKTLSFLENNPLHLERIVNDSSARSIRVDRIYRIALDPAKYLLGGNPDWMFDVTLLRIISHDDLYKHPR